MDRLAAVRFVAIALFGALLAGCAADLAGTSAPPSTASPVSSSPESSSTVGGNPTWPASAARIISALGYPPPTGGASSQVFLDAGTGAVRWGDSTA